MGLYLRVILLAGCATGQGLLHVLVYRARAGNPMAPITLLTSGLMLFVVPMLLGGFAYGLVLRSRARSDRGRALAALVAVTLPVVVCAVAIGIGINLYGS